MSDTISHFAEQMADLTSHRIEGVAVMGDTPFSAPIISHVEGNLWQGGCLGGAMLPDDFRYVLSLYPWEKYRLGPNTERREVRLYDSADGVDTATIYELAEWVNDRRAKGLTLVHCQAGLNRSGLVAGLALVLGGMAPTDAVALLRERRSPAVLCNPTFHAWLVNQPSAPVR